MRYCEKYCKKKKYEHTDTENFENTEADMFSTVYIGNKMTKIIKHKMVTPRGYRYDRK